MQERFFRNMIEMDQDFWIIKNFILQFVVIYFEILICLEVFYQSGMRPPPQQAIGDFFRKFDTDGNGLIDINEFKEFLIQFNQL